MNGMTTKANVYYLPAAEPAVTPPAPSAWTLLRCRLVRSWWRARLSLAQLRLGLRRARRPAADDYATLLRSVVDDSPAQLIERRPRLTRPAKVFDFEAARLRLRPVTN